MTLRGAIQQLRELHGNDDIPIYVKPAISKVIETLEMDAQEVRHGMWEGGEDAGKYCSVCHQRTLSAACMNATFDGIEYRQVITPFCMWCGAKMDEVEDE